MDKLVYQIALTKIPLVGSKLAKLLVSYCGGVENIFQASHKDLLAIPGIGKRIVENISSKGYFNEVEKELAFIEKNQVTPYFYLDKSYPARLKHYEDSPVMLYAKGNYDINCAKSIAFVGTRTPSKRGEATVKKIIDELKDQDVSVISGMAYGIDAFAHKAAATLGVPTIGVLGHGLDRVYPAQNIPIARQMLENGGGLLTEFTSGTKPSRENFPMRNRIIAALSDAVLIVETKEKGGSIITAEIANSYNKDVFAVPGRVNDITSKGCNMLIKRNKAALVESGRDIVYAMGWDITQKPKVVSPQLFLDLTASEQKIVDYLKATDEVHIDQTLFDLSIKQSEASSILLQMELKNIIQAIPGKKYILVS